MRLLSAILLLTLSMIVAQIVHAQSESDLVKQTQNPLANMISVPLQNNFDFGAVLDNQPIYCLTHCFN
jgi:hypothetical protein